MKKLILSSILVMLVVQGCGLLGKDLIVVTESDVPVAMKYQNRDGYWLSKGTFSLLAEKSIRYDYMIKKKLENENPIKKDTVITPEIKKEEVKNDK